MGRGDYMPAGGGHRKKKAVSWQEVQRRRKIFKKVKRIIEANQALAASEEQHAEDFLTQHLEDHE